jgi:transcriptional regulator with XRE-family HTH domain
MKPILQKDIAQKAGISKSYICQIFNGDRRPSWKTAKLLASATGTPPILWLEGTPSEIRTAIGQINPEVNQPEA